MEKAFAADVLVCGAGAAGLTLAIELARRGVSFRLVEAMDTAFAGSRGKGIQPRTLEVFEDLGIVDRIVACGGPYPPQRVYGANGFADSPVFEPSDASPGEPYRVPIMVPQFLTERVMRERLLELGHRPALGCKLVGLEQDGDGVTARVADASGEKTLRVRYLVGADGGRSFVRHALGIGFPGKTLGARALVADVELTGLGRDAWHRFNGSDAARQLAICPLAGTELFQIQAPIPHDDDADLSVDGLNAVLRERTGRDDICVRSVSWASAYTMNARLAERYRVGRVFLVGDAAHIHPPTGGQGLNTSVQDSYNLGWKLAAVVAGAATALLDSYQEERRPIAAGMLGLAENLLKEMREGTLRRGRDVHQLDLGYPASSLALVRSDRSDRLTAGDRAPDAPVCGAAGQPQRLFDLFRGPHWTLLGYEAKREAMPARPGLHIHVVGPRGDVVDDRANFRAAYALQAGDWILVRPDGYVGAIVASGAIAALEDHLDAMGLARAP